MGRDGPAERGSASAIPPYTGTTLRTVLATLRVGADSHLWTPPGWFVDAELAVER